MHVRSSINRSRLSCAVLGAGLTVTVLCTPAAAAETWRMYTYIPNTNSPVGEGLLRIVDRVKAETDGELKLQLFLGGSLPIKVSDISQAVGENIIQLAADSFVSGHVPIGGVVRLPMLVADQDLEPAMRVVRPRVDEAFAKLNVKVLGYYVWDRIHIYSTRPLEKIGDLAGRKVRQGSPESGALIRASGGSPLTLGSPEVAPALQQKLLDAVVTTTVGGGALWADSFTHSYRISMYRPESWIHANISAWNKLSPKTQAVLARIIQEEAARISQDCAAAEEKLSREQQAKGIVFVEPTAQDKAAITRSMEPVWTDWAKRTGPAAEALLAEVRAIVKK